MTGPLSTAHQGLRRAFAKEIGLLDRDLWAREGTNGRKI
jgi:hypothetical protein